MLDDLTVYGDVRLRAEYDFDLPDRSDRFRSRLRFRLGANYALGESWLAGGRLVTGDRDEPRSRHVTRGDGFDGLEVSLDRLFLEARPPFATDLRFVGGGNFDHPFQRNPV